jgi:surface carbohydrate biosynthesis protein
MAEYIVTRIKKLWRFTIFYIFSSKKKWRWPLQSEVLIFDSVGSDMLSKYLQEWGFEILHVRGEEINIPVLALSLFKKGKKTDAYLDCFIEKVCPKLLVTFIDNNPVFYKLSARHPATISLSIQNGFKSYYFDIFETWDQPNLTAACGRVDYMATFGSRVGIEYSKYIDCKILPIGSLKNNFFIKKEGVIKKGIAFISQFRASEGLHLGGQYFSHEEYFKNPDRKVLNFLVKYAEEAAIDLYIVPCSDNQNKSAFQAERDYYDTLLGKNIPFSRELGFGGGYLAIDGAEVVVSIDSALGYESAARGNKTALFTIRSHMLDIAGLSYGWPEKYLDEGFCWSNLPDILIFRRIMDHLFAISNEQYVTQLSESDFDEIMTYDPGNNILQAVLRQELESKSTLMR